MIPSSSFQPLPFCDSEMPVTAARAGEARGRIFREPLGAAGTTLEVTMRTELQVSGFGGVW